MAPAKEKSTRMLLDMGGIVTSHGLLLEKNEECTMNCVRCEQVDEREGKEVQTRRFRFLRYFLLRLRYAFHTQFQPGVYLPPVAKNTTV